MAKRTKLRPTGNGTVQRNPIVEYHIVPHGDRWDVERDDAFTGSFAHNLNTAIGLATAAAQREQHNGLEVMVCVQEPSGQCRKVWP